MDDLFLFVSKLFTKKKKKNPSLLSSRFYFKWNILCSSAVGVRSKRGLNYTGIPLNLFSVK